MTAYRLGVDVSHHQDPNKIDYHELKDEGYEWVIARAAYGTRPDDTFVTHCEKAKKAGLLVGGYTFYRQTQMAEAQYQAFEKQLARVDWDILPVVDLEWNEQYDGRVNPQLFNSAGRMLMESVAAEHGGAIAYLAPGFYQQLGSPEWLLRYPWWVAHYTQQSEPWCPMKQWSMWQYTGSGNTSGYAGDLDLNRAIELPLRKNRPSIAVEPPVARPALSDERSRLFREIADHHERLAFLYDALAKNEEKS